MLRHCPELELVHNRKNTVGWWDAVIDLPQFHVDGSDLSWMFKLSGKRVGQL